MLEIVDRRSDRDPGRRRTGRAAGGPICQRRSEATLGRIAEIVVEVVGDGAAGQDRPRVELRGDGRVLRSEAVGVIAEVLIVLALEFDREVRRAAIVLRIETVRLA